MMKRLLAGWLLMFLVVASISMAEPVLAKKTFGDAAGNLESVADTTGHEKTTVDNFIPKVVQTAFVAVGSTFLALMVYAGMKWMLARGNEEHITTARSTLINATIGLIVIVSAYAITSFITTRLIQGKKVGPDADYESTVGNETLGCCVYRAKAGMLGSGTWGWSSQTEGQCETQCSKDTIVQCQWEPISSSVECEKFKEYISSQVDKDVEKFIEDATKTN